MGWLVNGVRGMMEEKGLCAVDWNEGCTPAPPPHASIPAGCKSLIKHCHALQMGLMCQVSAQSAVSASGRP